MKDEFYYDDYNDEIEVEHDMYIDDIIEGLDDNPWADIAVEDFYEDMF